jgi:hypothetical protein
LIVKERWWTGAYGKAHRGGITTHNQLKHPEGGWSRCGLLFIAQMFDECKGSPAILGMKNDGQKPFKFILRIAVAEFTSLTCGLFDVQSSELN